MKTKQNPIQICLLGALALAMVNFQLTTASAQTYSITFSGTLDAITSTSPFWTGIAIGDAFTVTADYNLTPTGGYSSATDSIYDWVAQPFSISAAFGSYVFSMDTVRLEVRNNLSGQDAIIAGNGAAFSANGLQFNSVDALQAVVLSTVNDVIASTDLAAVANYPISQFEYHSFGLYNGTFNDGADTASVSGTVNSYSVSAVPEPSTLALAGVGGLSLLLFRKRK